MERVSTIRCASVSGWEGAIKRSISTLPTLRPDQRAIALSRKRFKVVACGRRWGKTTLGLVLAVRHALYGRQVWWVAPTYGLAFWPWRTLKSALVGRWASKSESDRHIDLPGGGSITVKSADNPDGLRGVGLDFLVVDEAAYVAEEAWTGALRPALSDRRGRALIISTPRGRNWFYRVFQRGRDQLMRQWGAWQHSTAANPLIPQEEIEEARGLLPERVFTQEYLAEFLADGGEVFSGVRAAATAPVDALPAPGRRCVMGVDFGRYQDYTALAVIDVDARPVPVMVALERFGGMSWSVQRARIAALARRWNVQGVLAEANAMGEPNIEALWREGLPITPFVTTARSKGGLIEGLAKAIAEGELRLLPDEVLLGELEAYTYSMDRYNVHTRYFAPPGLHDDTVIALALAWQLAASPRLALGVAEV